MDTDQFEEEGKNELSNQFHVPKSIIPNTGYGTVLLTYKKFKIVDVKSTTSHNLQESKKKKS